MEDLQERKHGSSNGGIKLTEETVSHSRNSHCDLDDENENEKQGKITTMVKNDYDGDNLVPPCLLCGEDLEESVIVKVEVEHEEEELICSEFYFGGGGSQQAKNSELQRGSIPERNLCKTSCLNKWTVDEKVLYKRFLKWFQVVDPVSKVKKKTSSKKRRSNDSSSLLLGWNDNSEEKDPFPFCPSCKGHLTQVLGLERKVEKLERTIRDIVGELKVKANSCEDVFGGKDIYQKDVRYRRVREQIVTDFKSRYSDEPAADKKRPKDKPKINLEKSRKSIRQKFTTLRYSSDAHCSKSDPMVLLTAADKSNAERHLHVFEGILDTDPTTESSNRITKQSTTRKRKKLTPKSLRVQVKTDKVNVTIAPPSPSVPLDLDDHFSDFNPSSPSTRPPKKSRKRNRKAKETKNSSFLDKDDSDPDLRLSPTPSHCERRNRKRKAKKFEDDKDWTVATDNEDDPSSANDDDDDFELENETGKKKRSRIIVDAKNKTLTYKNIVFNKLNVDPSSDNQYECTVCYAVLKYTPSKNNIYGHAKTHLNDASAVRKRPCARKQSQIKKNCRICLKPCYYTSRTMHEWTHKSEEEKRSALERGDSHIPSTAKRKHQCEV